MQACLRKGAIAQQMPLIDGQTHSVVLTPYQARLDKGYPDGIVHAVSTFYNGSAAWYWST